MPTKHEVLKEVDESPLQHYNKATVKALIGKVSYDSQKPSHLKAGDVFIYQVGLKRRPVVIVKVVDNLVYGIPLSSTEDEMNLSVSKSRFFSDGFFGKTITAVKINVAMDNFVGVYDNPKLLREAKKEIKNLIMNVL